MDEHPDVPSASPSGRLTALGRDHGRGLVSVIAFVLVAALVPGRFGVAVRLLAAWNAAAVVWLASTWAHLVRPPSEGSRWSLAADRARWERHSRPVRRKTGFVSVVASGLFGLVFALVLLFQLERPRSREESLVVGLSALAVVTAWLALHTAYARYYAYLHYGRDDGGGLRFPGDGEPNYLAFAYFSFTLGTSFAASDVTVDGRRMRGAVLGHTLLSFAYNTGVLGLVVNLSVIARL